MADTPAATPPIGQLASFGKLFNSIAFGAFDSQEAADAGNALFAENQDKLDAIQSELAPIRTEAGEQIAIVKANQPPVSIWDKLGQVMGFDPAELDDDARESIKAFAINRFGVPAEEFDKSVEADSEDIAAAKKLAVDAATERLGQLQDQASTVTLKLQEAISTLLKQALPEETFNSIASNYFEFDSEDGPAVISAAFAANNAPTLASAFAPRPQP
jgi:hypothetical protein